MITLVILGSISILLTLAFLAYYRIQLKQIRGYQTQIALQSLALEQSKETIQELGSEVSTIKQQFKSSLEDPVTHLLGKELFEDRLVQNINESTRYHFTLGVMFVDIDNFRMINDALTYEIGNQLLLEVANRLKTCIRNVDSITRFNKDTFVILLAQLNKPETAAIVAQRILQALKDPCVIVENEFYISVSIGISIFPTDGEDANSLLRNAEHALRIAKTKGSHLYQFHQEHMHTQSQRELALHTSLNRETIYKEFVVYYQPLLNVKDSDVFCMEALLHWQHPQLGLISPADLYSYAEKQNKLNNITEWLIANSCKQFMHWHSLGFKPKHLAIPITIRQLNNSQFIYKISQIIQKMKFEPNFLIFEIKESTVALPDDVLQKAFNMLKYIGIKVAIDNFGADTFALRYLKNISIHYLKLDPSLIVDIQSNEKAVALVKSLIFLAQNLSIEVIAKGVDSEAQVAILKGLDCFLMQGYILGSPLSVGEVTDKMIVPESS